MNTVYWENFARFIIAPFTFISSWQFKMGLMKPLK